MQGEQRARPGESRDLEFAITMVEGSAAAMQVGRNKVSGEVPRALAGMFWDSRKFSAEYRGEVYAAVAQAVIAAGRSDDPMSVGRLIEGVRDGELPPDRERSTFLALCVLAGTETVQRRLNLF
jgi:hypothetical protein